LDLWREELIKEKEINLCHVFEGGKWRYLRSRNLRVINKHNGHLSKLQKNKEDVKV
jgi:hypothetical protein